MCELAPEKGESLCGHKILIIILDQYGISSTLEELCALSNYNILSGTTILGLYKAATAKGLPAVPVKQ